MANSPIIFGGWPVGILLSDVLQEEQQRSEFDGQYNDLGSTTTIQRTRLASFVNRATEDVIDATGGFGYVASTPVTIVSGDGTAPLPAGMRGRDIVKATITDQTGYVLPFHFDCRAAIDQLIFNATQPAIGFGCPNVGCFSEDGLSIVMRPFSDNTYTLQFWYRAATAVCTLADIALALDGTGTAGNLGTPPTIQQLPTRLLTALALRVAIYRLGGKKPDLRAALQAEYSNKSAGSPGELERVLNAMRKVPASKRDLRSGLINTDAYFDKSFPQYPFSTYAGGR